MGIATKWLAYQYAPHGISLLRGFIHQVINIFHALLFMTASWRYPASTLSAGPIRSVMPLMPVVMRFASTTTNISPFLFCERTCIMTTFVFFVFNLTSWNVKELLVLLTLWYLISLLRSLVLPLAPPLALVHSDQKTVTMVVLMSQHLVQCKCSILVLN